MRNIETLSTKTGPDDAGLNILLDSLACHITSRQLNHVEAAELLRDRWQSRTKRRRSTNG